MESEQGNLFGKYRLIAELGSGGMADVFLAVASGPAGFNKLVVIKRLRSHLADEPEFLQMFLDEARLAARLNHPNIVQTNEVGAADQRYFIAMEFLDGQPLNKLISRANRQNGLTLALALRPVCEALAALQYAHEMTDFDGTPLEIVHRDISPHNIFVTYEGQVKLVDFGIAKAANSSAETRTGVLKGKVSYMSPEQAAGTPVDRRADIFAAGVLLWEAITGARPWKGMNDVQILHRLVSEGLPPIQLVSPEAPPELIAICERATSNDSSQRYSTASEMLAALENAIEMLGLVASPRELGRLVSTIFADKRAEVKAVIEQQLGRLSSASAVDLRVGALPALGGTMTGAGSFGSNGSSSGASTGPSSISRSGPFVGPDTPTADVPLARLSGEDDSSASASGVAQRSIPGENTRLGERGPRGSMGWIAAVFALSICVGAGFVFLRKSLVGEQGASGASGASSASSSTPASSGSNSDGSDAKGSTSVTFASEPASARLFLDDRELPSNPYTNRYTRDAVDHKLRVEANGFTTRSETVRFDRDPVKVSVTLESTTPAGSTSAKPQGASTPGGPSGPSGPSGQAGRSSSSTGAGGKSGKLPIDTGDPWK